MIRQDRLLLKVSQKCLARNNQPERQTLSPREVLATVVFSGLSMAVLYGLIKLGVNIVTIFNFWFIGVTASSIDVLLLNPVLKPYYSNREGSLFAYLNRHIVNMKYLELTIEMVLRFFLSLTLPVWWYIAMFNNAGYTWILQNTLGAFVCCYLALILRLPNLKVGTICLVLFLVYDVFMVFLDAFHFWWGEHHDGSGNSWWSKCSINETNQHKRCAFWRWCWQRHAIDLLSPEPRERMPLFDASPTL